ncbi:PfkB family carbohydrate kinase [Microbacterium sp. ANT_H45B]|uniref:PfkB family carbohydrate kinase n=1 Tax=Microbacterium sp. ANT_H45B TaxID=2597346 RepID=UPI00292EB0BB|nr:PfkB family carbohydrate kinase [Microbacterium sp. ANT_H45B]
MRACRARVLVEAVDTIGAGDTFMASSIRSVLEHGSRGLGQRVLERVGHDAVCAAAITVSRAGVDLPWESELRQTNQ